MFAFSVTHTGCPHLFLNPPPSSQPQQSCLFPLPLVICTIHLKTLNIPFLLPTQKSKTSLPSSADRSTCLYLPPSLPPRQAQSLAPAVLPPMVGQQRAARPLLQQAPRRRRWEGPRARQQVLVRERASGGLHWRHSSGLLWVAG